jgi:hypothetical protein
MPAQQLPDRVRELREAGHTPGRCLQFGTADRITRTVEVTDKAVARDERRVESPLPRPGTRIMLGFDRGGACPQVFGHCREN